MKLILFTFLQGQEGTTVQIQKSSSSTKTFQLEKSKSRTEMAGPEINAPVFPVETKHNFPPEAPAREPAPGKDDLKFPILGVDGKHQYKAETPKPLDEKHLHGPAFDVEHTHS